MICSKETKKRRNYISFIFGFVFMMLNKVQCYAIDGENYITKYKDKPVIFSGKFILIQNSVIILMALTIIMLLAALYIYINKYKKYKKNYEELIAKDKIRSDYNIIIAHELRTPLNIIINSAKLLKEYLISSDEVDKQYVISKYEYIINNSSRLLRTINNSIDAALIETGVVSMHFENYNIVESVEDIITASQEYAVSHNVSLIFDPQEEEIITAIDRCKIERAILNLISNSIKNIDGGGNIVVSCARKGKEIIIQVTDDGMGMSDFTREHLFEKFYQSSPDILNRGHEGSGLGMYITYNLIKIHGGDMKVESELNEGTTITISLPIRIVDTNVNSLASDAKERARIEFADIYK